LTVIETSSDGFYISEKDLELRGPGDFFGTRQHGLPALKTANPMEDTALLYKAKEAVDKLLKGILKATDGEKKILNHHINSYYFTKGNNRILN
ncbi:MAG: DNA helicase RecG, partial [Clostridia bacterium]|nr:DNA helicase RecG [Clostridia bacterium]